MSSIEICNFPSQKEIHLKKKGLLTPNMDRRSGSRNRNGILDTCSRFGCALDSAMAVAAATAAATLWAWACCCCCCCWAATWLASWAAATVLSAVPEAVVVVVAVVNRPGLLLLLLLAAAIAELTAAGSGEVVLLVMLLLVALTLLLALETCVSGSVCCNNSVFLSWNIAASGCVCFFCVNVFILSGFFFDDSNGTNGTTQTAQRNHSECRNFSVLYFFFFFLVVA